LDPTMDAAQEDRARERSAAGMALRPLRGRQRAGAHRQGWLFPELGRLSDAHQERPGAARPALFQANAEVTPSDDSNRDEVHARRLEPHEWAAVFPIVAQLRPHLDVEEFLAR